MKYTIKHDLEHEVLGINDFIYAYVFNYKKMNDIIDVTIFYSIIEQRHNDCIVAVFKLKPKC